MNLYQWLNARNYARFERSLNKSVDDIQAGKVTRKALTWDELQEKWAAAEAREAARPLLLRKGRDAYWAARRFARQCTPRRVINRIVWYHQRARRGWSDYDAWSFDSYISRVMSQGMARLAASTHSWPGEQSKWPTFEEWQDHLTSMSVRLGAWNLDTDSFSDKEMFEVTRKAMHEWADNFGHYWD